jgi:hypothetical protein
MVLTLQYEMVRLDSGDDDDGIIEFEIVDDKIDRKQVTDLSID